MRVLAHLLSASAVAVVLSTASGAGAMQIIEDAPPVTKEEYAAIMTDVGPAFVSMRNKLASGDYAQAAGDARQLVQLFEKVERFWAQHKKPDAMNWAKRARTYANHIAGVSDAAQASLEGQHAQRTHVSRLKLARTASTNMGATCKQCHAAYRVGDEASGFSIKAGALAE